MKITLSTFKRAYYLVFIFLSIFNTLIGQELLVNEINVFTGASNVPIYTIQNDDKGFIYLSTEKGIIRYNGFSFYKYELEGANNESFNFLYRLKDDRVVAINFYEGIYELVGDKFVKKTIFGIKDYKYTFFSLAELGKRIYLHTDIAIFVLDKDFQIIKLIDKQFPEFKNIYFTDMVKVKDTIYIFTKDTFLYKIDVNQNIEKIPLPTSCNYIATYNKNTLYYTCKSGSIPLFKRQDGNTTKVADLSLPQGTSIYKIKSHGNFIYLCTSYGIIKINENTKETSWIIKNKRTNDLLLDYQGNYWAITLDGELLNWNNLDAKKIKINTKQIITNTLNIGNNKFIIATSINDFYLFDNKTYKIDYLGQFGEHGVKFLMHDPIQNHIHFQHGFIDLNSRKYKHFYSGNFIAQNTNGERIYCISNRIMKYTRKPIDSTYIYVPEINGYLKSIYESRSYKAAYVDTIPYILLFNGVIKYENDSIVFVKDLLSGKSITGYDMVVDSKNNIWIVNLDRGIEVYQYEFLKKTFNMQNYFSKGSSILKLKYNSPYILALYQDGLILIHEDTYDIIDVNSILGKFSNEMRDALVENDTLYIFTKDEIIISTIRKNSEHYARIFLKNITDLESNVFQITNTEPIKIKSKTFFLNYDLLSFSNLGGIRIAYRMKDIDSSWNIISADISKIFFPYLLPGKHLIEMAAVNNSGKIISEIQHIHVIIPQPFFQSPTFYTILVFLIIGLLSVLYYFNELKNKKKEHINNQIRMSKLTALRARMNPHFVYNILNSIQSLIYIGDKRTASTSLSKFSELMRLVLELSDKENISLNDEIHVIELYLELEKLRFGDEFKYSIELDNELKYLNPEIPGFFIQPFVENSIKHGLLHKSGEKRLLFKIEKGANNDVRIIVDDNGVGRKKSAEINARRNLKKSSFAVEAIINRINLINSQLKRKIVLQIFDKVDLNNEPSGTTVIISIPVELELDI